VSRLRNSPSLGFPRWSGIPVAWMLASSDAEDTIAYFLNLVRHRNPLVVPRIIMTDCDQAQIVSMSAARSCPRRSSFSAGGMFFTPGSSILSTYERITLFQCLIHEFLPPVFHRIERHPGTEKTFRTEIEPSSTFLYFCCYLLAWPRCPRDGSSNQLFLDGCP